MKNKTKKKLIIVISILCVLLGGLLFFMQTGRIDINPKPYVEPSISSEQAVDKSLELAKSHYEQFYNNSQLNEDFKAILFFEDDWLNLDIVQAYNNVYNSSNMVYSFYSYEGNHVNSNTLNDEACDGRPCSGNDVYIKMDWKTMRYDQWGSNFFDYRNSYNLYDENLIMYTHHASREYFGDEKAETIQGTKLDYLLNEENYKDHSTFYLLTEDEIRTYQIASVFKLDIQNDNDMQILYRTDLNTDLYGNVDNAKEKIFKHIRNRQLYNTSVELNDTSKYLTISTCIQGQSDRYREIIIGKLIESKPINQIKKEYLEDLRIKEELKQQQLEQELKEEGIELTQVEQPAELVEGEQNEGDGNE